MYKKSNGIIDTLLKYAIETHANPKHPKMKSININIAKINGNNFNIQISILYKVLFTLSSKFENQWIIPMCAQSCSNHMFMTSWSTVDVIF